MVHYSFSALKFPFLKLEKGAVYSTGSNEYHQLGRDNPETRRFNRIDELDEPVSYASCGGGHTVLVTVNGRVYSFGDGTKGQLGHGPDLLKSTPKAVSSLKKVKIERVACGECHTAFISGIFSCIL
jgi:alpha-tubulin suppressor-like RCC1 family protein